ncbi:hypothetical protein HC931_26130 [Candidatus Gracilibacteria bacterium]|nr:hypothetical protein [Candidatus Gracilibacteria bacterium]
MSKIDAPFTLDNLPTSVDKRQCFTAEEFYRVKEDFSLSDEFPKYALLPSFSRRTNIRQVQMFFDERLVLSWNDGVITFQLYLPQDFKPQNLVYTVNGEIARVISGGRVVLDRMEHLDFDSMLKKAYAAMESGRRQEAFMQKAEG